MPLSKAIQLMEQCHLIEEKDVCLLKAIKVAIARNMQIDVFKLDCKPVVDDISLSSTFVQRQSRSFITLLDSPYHQ